MEKMLDYICIVYKKQIVEKGLKESFYIRSYLQYVIMSSEVKLMYQSDIEINVNSGNLILKTKTRRVKKKFPIGE